MVLVTASKLFRILGVPGLDVEELVDLFRLMLANLALKFLTNNETSSLLQLLSSTSVSKWSLCILTTLSTTLCATPEAKKKNFVKTMIHGKYESSMICQYRVSNIQNNLKNSKLLSQKQCTFGVRRTKIIFQQLVEFLVYQKNHRIGSTLAHFGMNSLGQK